MKRSELSNILSSIALAGSLAVVPFALPADAQTGTDASPSPNQTTDTYSSPSQNQTNYATDTETDRDFDWGWLGLLGLAGLAGLARKREEPARYREPEEVSRTGTRY